MKEEGALSNLSFLRYNGRRGEHMLNILVCDDDKEIVEAIEIYLIQAGYHVYLSLIHI